MRYGVLVLLVVLAGCGSTPTPEPVRLFFTMSATTGQERAIETRLRHEHGVTSVRFVSRVKSWAYMQRKYPVLAASVAVNPLPDRLDLMVRKDAVDDLVRRYEKAPSVDNVMPPVKLPPLFRLLTGKH